MNGTVKFGEWISGAWRLFRTEWQTRTLFSLLFLTPIFLVILAGVPAVVGIVFSRLLAFTAAVVVCQDCFRQRDEVDDRHTTLCRMSVASVPSRSVFSEQRACAQV